MAIKLHASTLYHPSTGMSPDANGVTAKPTDALDAVNTDITMSEVVPRNGTLMLGGSQPQEIVISGGTVGDIVNGTYEWIEGAQYTTFKWDRAPSDNYFIGLSGSQTGVWEVYTLPADGSGSPNKLKELITPFPVPLNPPKTGWEDFASGDPDDLVLTYQIPQPLEDVIKYHSYIHPVSGLMLFAFTSVEIYRYDPILYWVPVATPVFPDGLDTWSITDFVDREIGATVVASGSVYYSPLEPPVGESSRILLYYDPADNSTNGTFEVLQMRSDLLTSEVLGALPVISANGAVVTDADVALVSNTPIVPSSLAFVVAGAGVIATTGQLTYESGGETYQNLIPVQDNRVIYGNSSWINLDTGEWSIYFANSAYSGEVLDVYYSQAVDTDFYPIHVFNFHNSLVIANTREDVNGTLTNFPWRIRWTPPNIIDAILQNDYVELALDDISPILALTSLETAASSTLLGPMYIYKHNSIIRGTYNQNYKLDVNSPVPLMSFEIAYSEGIEAVNTIASIGGVHYYLGRNDVYMFNGYERQSITFDRQTGGTRIRDLMFANIDYPNMEKCHAVYDEERRRYMLFVKLVDGTIYPINAFVYDIDRDMWWRYTMPETQTAISTDLITEGTIGNLAGTIDSYPDSITIDSLSGAQKKLALFAMGPSGYYWSDPGDGDKLPLENIDVDSYIISRDFYAATLEEQDRVQQVNIEGRGSEMEIGYNTNYSLDPLAYEQLDDVPFGSIYSMEKYLPDVITTKIRFLIRLKGSTRFRWMQVFSKKQEFQGE